MATCLRPPTTSRECFSYLILFRHSVLTCYQLGVATHFPPISPVSFATWNNATGLVSSEVHDSIEKIEDVIKFLNAPLDDNAFAGTVQRWCLAMGLMLRDAKSSMEQEPVEDENPDGDAFTTTCVAMFLRSQLDHNHLQRLEDICREKSVATVAVPNTEAGRSVPTSRQISLPVNGAQQAVSKAGPRPRPVNKGVNKSASASAHESVAPEKPSVQLHTEPSDASEASARLRKVAFSDVVEIRHASPAPHNSPHPFPVQTENDDGADEAEIGAILDTDTSDLRLSEDTLQGRSEDSSRATIVASDTVNVRSTGGDERDMSTTLPTSSVQQCQDGFADAGERGGESRRASSRQRVAKLLPDGTRAITPGTSRRAATTEERASDRDPQPARKRGQDAAFKNAPSTSSGGTGDASTTSDSARPSKRGRVGTRGSSKRRGAGAR